MLDINREQRRAANPFSSVWVSASAGSGKTKVLTDRVLNILLMAGQPERLLCLTFTKAAAAEMANRITDTLKNWATMPKEELAAALEALTGEYDDEMAQKARRLFANALDTPGGLKIMTIHSFCQSVLKRFPLEADVPPNFDVIDDIQQKKLVSDAIKKTFENPAFSEEIKEISMLVNEQDLIELIKNILEKKAVLTTLTQQYSSLESLFFAMKKELGLISYHTYDDIFSPYTFETFSEKRKKYLYADERGILRKFQDDSEAHQIWNILNLLRSWQIWKQTCTLLRFVFQVMESYHQEKRTKALMDYTDLIECTKNLLNRSDMAAWVLFKLDGGIDHILVDEAQDTNPSQWQIIQRLAEEFFAGMGYAEDRIRTLFAVGDKKQSIYSFQGADPEEFERVRDYFKERIIAAQHTFENVPLNRSFRSTKAILELVNFVLKNPKASKGILKSGEEAIHIAHRENDGGLVEIHPVIPYEKQPGIEPWKPPVERLEHISSCAKMTEIIANKIKELLDNPKEILESKNRRFQPGDFLILVQRRNAFVYALVRALKERHIPVAGVDRIHLTDQIAVSDLLAIAKFVLLPEDNLNLACVLKSPFIGMSEEELFEAAYHRKNQSLWQRVQLLFPEYASPLNRLLNTADKIPPFDFFSYILSALGGRQKFLSRLGEEANEALDEFLNLVAVFEQQETPSLELFLDWISNQDIEIKRDMDQGNLNAVRIMTVHGSKGLQGNVVILPQTRAVKSKTTHVVWSDKGFPFWVPSKLKASTCVLDLMAQVAEEECLENHRLLYVALTRAKDRLYIYGYDGGQKPPLDNWYDLICDSLPYRPDDDGIIRIQSPQKTVVPPQENKPEQEDFSPLPSWLLREAPSEALPEKPLTPSHLAQNEPITSSVLTEQQEHALKRGTFIHKLLQLLPEIEPEKRWEVAQKLCPSDIEIPHNLLTLLTTPEFSFLFAPNTLAEVPILGKQNGHMISGQIDRLVVMPTEVYIIDFKTNRTVPTSVGGVSDSYRTQLRVYKDLLKPIFPDKVIRTYLLWTENLTLMEITE